MTGSEAAGFAEVAGFASIPPTALADLLGREQVMDIGIRPLWNSPRVAGPAFTVRCPPGDNLMPTRPAIRSTPGSGSTAPASTRS